MLNMCQISSLMAAAEGPVAAFSSFANFEEKKRKSNLLMSIPKTVNQMGSFGQIRKISLFRFCRPILDIFGFTLLISCTISFMLVPRGRVPFGQHQESQPLGRSNIGSPQFTDFAVTLRMLKVRSERILKKLSYGVIIRDNRRNFSTNFSKFAQISFKLSRMRKMTPLNVQESFFGKLPRHWTINVNSWSPYKLFTLGWPVIGPWYNIQALLTIRAKLKLANLFYFSVAIDSGEIPASVSNN